MEYNSLIAQVNNELITKGYPLASKRAREWLFLRLKEMRMTPRTLMKDIDRQKRNILIGNMYFFFYHAKYNDTLPFWDKFPLVIPLEKYSDGFLGLNLHYVPTRLRLMILSKLSKKINNKKMDETTRMRVSYDYISSLKNADIFKPCIKRYLTSQVRSRYVVINPDEWYFSCLLPFERFQKKTKKEILGILG